MIDDKWFKAQQRRVGVTTEDIAKEIGRDRTAVSHIYTGRQKMNLAWAKAFSRVLQVPLDEVLRRAGVADYATASALAPGNTDDDVEHVLPPDDGEDPSSISIADCFSRAAMEAMDQRLNVDIWRVRTTSMIAEGYLPGDFILTEADISAPPRMGDTVLARVHENARGTVVTILRRYEPPVLIKASVLPEDRRVHVVDGANVVIIGRVIASWRA